MDVKEHNRVRIDHLENKMGLMLNGLGWYEIENGGGGAIEDFFYFKKERPNLPSFKPFLIIKDHYNLRFVNLS